MSDAASNQTPSFSSNGEEELRFIRNFHDVFLSMGLGMLIFGIALASSLIGGNLIIGSAGSNIVGLTQSAAVTAALIAFVDAAIVWGLAEVFARSRRLFLPAIVILLGFVSFFAAGATSAYLATLNLSDIGDFDSATLQFRTMILVYAAAATIATFAYYVRMKLPFAMGLFGASLAATGVAAAAIAVPSLLTDHLLMVFFLSGVFLFLLGVVYDAQDPERRTRISDNGFWLHFFAAPLIFFSVTRMVAGDGGPAGGGTAAATATLAIVVLFAIISLLINRRALLVSGLISAAIAVWVLVSETGIDGAWTGAATLLILGGAMVLLGGGWHSTRRLLVGGLPKDGLIARIIPPETGPNPRDQVIG